jgi:hypothetical protein
MTVQAFDDADGGRAYRRREPKVRVNRPARESSWCKTETTTILSLRFRSAPSPLRRSARTSHRAAESNWRAWWWPAGGEPVAEFGQHARPSARARSAAGLSARDRAMGIERLYLPCPFHLHLPVVLRSTSGRPSVRHSFTQCVPSPHNCTHLRLEPPAGSGRHQYCCPPHVQAYGRSSRAGENSHGGVSMRSTRTLELQHTPECD